MRGRARTRAGLALALCLCAASLARPLAAPGPGEGALRCLSSDARGILLEWRSGVFEVETVGRGAAFSVWNEA